MAAAHLRPSPSDLAVAARFTAQLAHRINGRLQRALLFGSRARGEAMADSDFDILLLVDRRDAAVKRAVDAAAYLCCPEFLDVHVFTPQRWAWSTAADAPLLRHALAEGVQLWPETTPDSPNS